MLTLLPFLSGLLALWFGILGRRRPCVTFWVLTLALFLVAADSLLTGSIPVVL